jgi:hypothetical protein
MSLQGRRNVVCYQALKAALTSCCLTDPEVRDTKCMPLVEIQEAAKQTPPQD